MDDDESSNLPPHKTQLIVALDFDTWEEASQLINELGKSVNYYKIGYQLFFREGMEAVHKLIALKKKVFLDLKLGDIPRTMRAAALAIPEGVSMLSVQGDPATIRDVKEARPKMAIFFAYQFSSQDFDEDEESDVTQGWYEAIDAGASGFIVAGDLMPLAQNLRVTVRAMKRMQLLVPGVRLVSQETNDHITTINPQQAHKNNVDFIVVGRPIIFAPDRLAAVKSFS